MKAAAAFPRLASLSRAGIGLRAPHQMELLSTPPPIGFVEVHSENYFGAGGRAIHFLEQTRELFAVSLHGVGLSLGSVDALDERHLASLARLVERIDPVLVSDHLCWCSVDGTHTHDLLPLPYTDEALEHIVPRVQAVQERLRRRILLENPSTYLEFAESLVPEPEFLAEVARRTGCGILLDVNNVYVSARNHGFDANAWLDAIPHDFVSEMHLAGHVINRIDDCDRGREIVIDTHSRPVAPAVWALYRHAVARFGSQPTIVEWDADLPTLDVLVLEAARADRIASEVNHAWTA